MECVVYIATSYDGKIARADGSLDWLPGAQPDSPELGMEEDFGFVEFFNSVDTLVMGRNTYEKVLSFGQWPYEGKQVIVLSQSIEEVDPSIKSNVKISKESPQELVSRLESEGAHKVWIDGGGVIRSFLDQGLIDSMILTKFAVIIGEGISLFDGIQKDIHFKGIERVEFPQGIVQERISLK